MTWIQAGNGALILFTLLMVIFLVWNWSQSRDVKSEEATVKVTDAHPNMETSATTNQKVRVEVSEHGAGGGHPPKYTLLFVLLVVVVVGEIGSLLAFGIPNYIRAINTPYDFRAHNRILPQSAFAWKPAAPIVIPKPGVMQIPAVGTGYSKILPIPAGTDLCLNLSPGEGFGVENRKRPFTDNDHWVDVGAAYFDGSNANRFYGTTAETMPLGYGFVPRGEACPSGDYPTA